MIFKIGDMIFYPGHGVGIVDCIEEKEVNEVVKTYYRLHLINNPMKVLVPLDIVDTLHLRLISDSNTVDCILKDISRRFTKLNDLLVCNYKDRKSVFMEKIKIGTIEEYLDVILALTKLKGKHDLNSTEKQLLYRAKKIILEEICASKNLSIDEANDLLESALIVSEK